MIDGVIRDVIDVDYEVLSPDDDGKDTEKKNTDITVNVDPTASLISGFFGSIDNFTNAVKEYNICKQQEQTKRAAIKAQMKVALAEIQVRVEQIHADKEKYLRELETQHEERMYQLKEFYGRLNKALDAATTAVHEAIEAAKETKDFSEVRAMLECECTVLKLSNEAELRRMEMTRRIHLEETQPKALLN